MGRQKPRHAVAPASGARRRWWRVHRVERGRRQAAQRGAGVETGTKHTHTKQEGEGIRFAAPPGRVPARRAPGTPGVDGGESPPTRGGRSWVPGVVEEGGRACFQAEAGEARSHAGAVHSCRRRTTHTHRRPERTGARTTVADLRASIAGSMCGAGGEEGRKREAGLGSLLASPFRHSPKAPRAPPTPRLRFLLSTCVASWPPKPQRPPPHAAAAAWPARARLHAPPSPPRSAPVAAWSPRWRPPRTRNTRPRSGEDWWGRREGGGRCRNKTQRPPKAASEAGAKTRAAHCPPPALEHVRVRGERVGR